MLTIRNVSTAPIELKGLERFEEAQTASCLLDVVRGRWKRSRSTPPTAAQLADKSGSFIHQDVNIPIAPFDTKATNIDIDARKVLRLIFEVRGQRYRLDLPTANHRSTVLIPLSPAPSSEYTAVYLHKTSYLVLFASAKLASWMQKLQDGTPLSALSIPGTHNSPTHHTALPSVRCQAVNVREQLDNGVRFLDIRVQPESPYDPSKEGLILVHSAFPVSLTGAKYFRDLVDVVQAFLEANPSETVIMSLKREGVGPATDQQLSKILHNHYATEPAKWFTENRIPILGEVRGKIIIIRRFFVDESLKEENNGKGWCIDAESWPDNCIDGVCSSGEIRVQDFYEVGESINIEKKITYASDQLGRSSQTVAVLPGNVNSAAKEPIFINFLSASNFWRTGCWPEKIAAKVNPKILDFLCSRHNDPWALDAGEKRNPVGDGSTGIVVCDYVGNRGDWDLVRCILAMNAKLEMREQDLPFKPEGSSVSAEGMSAPLEQDSKP